ncbi:MAG: DUF4845 domain-containing protein [Gammaproteobacteria bacterium]
MLLIVGFAISAGIRLVPIYINAYTVETVVREVTAEPGGGDRNPGEIWASIYKRLDINDVENIKHEHFVYARDRGVTTIGVKYEARTPLFGNLDMVAKFSPMVTLNVAAAE